MLALTVATIVRSALQRFTASLGSASGSGSALDQGLDFKLLLFQFNIGENICAWHGGHCSLLCIIIAPRRRMNTKASIASTAAPSM